jgi:hypothetical protein
MRITASRGAGIALFTLISATVSAQGSLPDPARFAPFKLAGDWRFTSNNTGRKYRGDIEVDVQSIDASGVMHGQISHDGRQTNDLCNTRGMFGDEPVDATVTRTTEGFRLQYSLKCVSGTSPRAYDRSFLCNGTTCTFPIELSHGQGAITLEIVR